MINVFFLSLFLFFIRLRQCVCRIVYIRREMRCLLSVREKKRCLENFFSLGIEIYGFDIRVMVIVICFTGDVMLYGCLKNV